VPNVTHQTPLTHATQTNLCARVDRAGALEKARARNATSVHPRRMCGSNNAPN